MSIEKAVRNVGDFSSLIALLVDELYWQVDASASQEEITFDWAADDLRLSRSSAERLKDGAVMQLRFANAQPPWGVFFVEFTKEKVYRTDLRQILRGLVPKARRDPALPAWKQDQLLFICTTADYGRFTFAYFRGDKPQSAKLATFGWEREDRNIHTLCEFNLPALKWPEDEHDRDAWLAAWAKGFDKEPITRDFFKRFDAAIDAVKSDLEKHQALNSTEAYTRAQLLLLRMIFVYFLQNRGWLNQQRDYLLGNFNPHRDRPEEFSYYHEFLEKLFWTLSSPPHSSPGRFPGLPFLNGGLFDDDEFDPGPRRKKQTPPLNVGNATFGYVFDEFLEKFNFTVREDTPLNQEVAVDPEMLGKVFESIVLHAEAADPEAIAPDKRKATGSYYTPRIVVHFICQEALRQYLIGRLPGEEFTSSLAELMKMDASDGLDADEMRHLRDLLKPEEANRLLPHLAPKCCDPAVGSGAFPVGLLHELVNLRRVIQTAANGYVDPVKKKGSDWLHETKEEIIQDCLYGVDIQQQAIEICQLRLWLSLVVDYHLGIDPFTASRDQFISAIERISQLPNLEMNFRRGDSLHDYISGQPLVIQREATQRFRKDIEYIHDKGVKLHKAKKAEQKRKLRVEILERRLDLSLRALQAELQDWRVEHSKIADTLFADETASKAERRNRIEQETERIKTALKKIGDDEKELDRLKRSEFDARFYQRLRRLEGADFDSPFNFAWQIDFADIFAPKPVDSLATLRGEFAFVNDIDPQPTFLDKREEPGGFDIVVGNPPFVTARNPKKRELYRERWKRVCSGKYLLVCPFFEMSFGLLRPGGQLGFIVSNAFAKREFGKPLIETFFPIVDLQKVVDCSGLMFPGHGTPTCIVFGRHQKPVPGSPIRVAAVLPGGGDLRTPPEESPLWATLAERNDTPGYSDPQVSIVDRDRQKMATWPWSFDVGNEPTKGAIEIGSDQRLFSLLAGGVGFDMVTGSDEFFVLGADVARRLGLPAKALRPYLTGEDIRNWELKSTELALFPYAGRTTLPLEGSGFEAYARAFRWHLSERIYFGKRPAERGMRWWEYAIVMWSKRESPLRVGFSQIATHGHFSVAGDQVVFKEKAPIVKLPNAAGESDYELLAALLNASTALFWLKQVCFSKRESQEGATDTYFEFAGGKLEQMPVPFPISSAIKCTANPLVCSMTRLSRGCLERGQALSALSLTKLFESSREAYNDWTSGLPGYVEPNREIATPFPSAAALRSSLALALQIREGLRAEMIARQEEMDWLAYEAYGLIEQSQAVILRGFALAAFGENWDNVAQLALAREQRPFVLWTEADGDLDRAIELIPAEWSSARKELWKARLQLIASNEHIQRIEQPVYKRRWDEQWKVGARWQCGQPAYDQELIDAFTWWLSEKAEWWLENKSRNGVASLDEWAAALWKDTRIQAGWSVTAEAINRLEIWKREQKTKPSGLPPVLDASLAAFVQFLKATVKEQAVPDGMPFAVPYEKIPKDISAQVRKVRGRLNVPRERFWVTEAGLYRVASFGELVPPNPRPFE
jgi:hypothetical protein